MMSHDPVLSRDPVLGKLGPARTQEPQVYQMVCGAGAVEQTNLRMIASIKGQLHSQLSKRGGRWGWLWL
jgi:hypothetical protein